MISRIRFISLSSQPSLLISLQRGWRKVKAKVAFTVDQEVLNEIDSLRGLTHRSTYINHVLKIGLSKLKEDNKKPEGKEKRCRVN